jgi:hypothetical protein
MHSANSAGASVPIEADPHGTLLAAGVRIPSVNALVAGSLSLVALLMGREGLGWLEGSGASCLAMDEELRTTGALAAEVAQRIRPDAPRF